MEAVYILEPGAYIRREGASLRVIKDKREIDRIPADGLKRLILIGYISLSGSVLDFLIQRRIETVFLTPTGRFRARLAIDEHRHVAMRRTQYLRLSDGAFALDAARRIVAGKIESMRAFLMKRAAEYRDEEIAKAAVRLRAVLKNMEGVQDLNALRGVEGGATRIYYSVFDKLIRNKDFAFNGRNRRPPLDPVNALLSFVYTLLTNEVLSAIKTAGLDPYLGALHEVDYGRPSLACDLVEEYRVILGDRFVLGMLNRKMVNPTDFIFRSQSPENYVDEEEMKKKRPVEMKPAVSRTLVSAYEEMMKNRVHSPGSDRKVTYRNLILEQVRRFERFLEKPENGFQAFEWKL